MRMGNETSPVTTMKPRKAHAEIAEDGGHFDPEPEWRACRVGHHEGRARDQVVAYEHSVVDQRGSNLRIEHPSAPQESPGVLEVLRDVGCAADEGRDNEL